MALVAHLEGSLNSLLHLRNGKGNTGNEHGNAGNGKGNTGNGKGNTGNGNAGNGRGIQGMGIGLRGMGMGCERPRRRNIKRGFRPQKKKHDKGSLEARPPAAFS